MHLNTLKTALYCATVAFFFFSSVLGQESQIKNLWWLTVNPEQALEQKLDEPVKKEEGKTTKKGKRVVSVTEKVTADDPNLTPREREIKIRAREIELQKELKKLNEKKRKMETPSERQARKEIERQERNHSRLENDELRSENNAEISGCPDGTVWISKRATQRSNWRVMTMVRITNTGTLPVDIESPLYGGVLVRDLCSGGSVTVSFALGWSDPDQLQIPLTAISRPQDGGLATADFYTYVSKFDIQSNRVRTQTWLVRVNRQYQVH